MRKTNLAESNPGHGSSRVRSLGVGEVCSVQVIELLNWICLNQKGGALGDAKADGRADCRAGDTAVRSVSWRSGGIANA